MILYTDKHTQFFWTLFEYIFGQNFSDNLFLQSTKTNIREQKDIEADL